MWAWRGTPGRGNALAFPEPDDYRRVRQYLLTARRRGLINSSPSSGYRIGTQIIAKGYHFPLLTLVGAVDSDLGLQGGDLRAAERTYQLLSGVRPRRPGKPGRSCCRPSWHDTRHPGADRRRPGEFLATEQDARRAVEMPPSAG